VPEHASADAKMHTMASRTLMPCQPLLIFFKRLVIIMRQVSHTLQAVLFAIGLEILQSLVVANQDQRLAKPVPVSTES
jgi:hypothetical protein